ncbi:MAG: DMT family transporter, partial [Bdellovibrionales bacterium]|nr:DMT family transporter [Oligoflexia bacterium]
HTPPNVLTFWRFAFGLLALYLLSRRVDQVRIEIPFVPHELPVVRSLFLMALLPGFIAVALYYRGLGKVPASVATILELSFPLVAIGINSYFLGFQLSPVQLLGAAALLASMTGISLAYSKRGAAEPAGGTT